jgi:hypothetical protein
MSQVVNPVVDVIIPVHSATRPIARAVASVVHNTAAPVRVTVVPHNIDRTVIERNLGGLVDHPSVRVMPFHDGVPSPAGPFNHGLDLATAPFTSVLGSDDEFEPGAIDSWLTLQGKSQAAAVIARIYHEGRGFDPYPPVRRGHLGRLDGAKDRLAYRSAPLGLIARKQFGNLRFTEGLPSGEDLAYVTFIWFSGEKLAFDLEGPGYLGHHDAVDRVSHGARPVVEDFAFLDEILEAPWFFPLSLAQRRAIVIKLLRMQFFDAVLARLDVDPLPTEDRLALRTIVERLLSAAPGVETILSRVDHKVMDLVLSGVPGDQTRDLLAERWNYRSVAAVITRNPLRSFDRQAPFRTLLAGAIVARTARRVTSRA